LALDALVLEDALDAQHLLDLVADQQLVLELQGHVLADVHGAQLLVGNHLGAGFVALAGVGFERQQVFASDHGRIVGRAARRGKLKYSIPAIELSYSRRSGAARAPARLPAGSGAARAGPGGTPRA